MMPSQLSINRHVLVQVRKDLLSTRSVAPIAHQITHNREQAVKLDTGAGHLVVGRVADELGGGARGFDIGEDGVAGGAEGEGQEGGADVRGDACEDDLFLAGGFDGCSELGVVPGAEVC